MINQKEKIKLKYRTYLENVISNNKEYYTYLGQTLGINRNALESAIYSYNGVGEDSHGNGFYQSILAPATLDFHGQVIGSYHRTRERCIEDFLALVSPKMVAEVGFGYPSSHIVNHCLKEKKFKMDLFDFSESILSYTACAFAFYDKEWNKQAKLLKYNMNNHELGGDYDAYLFLDSIEHTDKPTQYLKDLVKRSKETAQYILSIPIGNLAGGSIEDFHYIEWLNVDASRNWLDECGLEIVVETEIKTNRGIDHFASFLPNKELICHMVLCRKKHIDSNKTDGDFLYELGMLNKMPRSGQFQLGVGSQTIAEHSFRAAYIGYILANRTKNCSPEKVALMCLFHDLEETRVHDIIPSQKSYVIQDKQGAINDMLKNVSGGNNISNLIAQFISKGDNDSILAQDADQLEWILSLQEIKYNGNKRASDWIQIALKRLITEESKQLAQEIQNTHPDSWWKKICDIK
jgi:putative hydrolase of HD superfamily